MSKNRRRRIALATSLLIGSLLVAGTAGIARSGTVRADAEGTLARTRLADLEQEVPSELEVRPGPGGAGFRLGFRSAVSNVGVGPLILEGARDDQATPEMTVDQIIERDGAGEPVVVHDVGRMQYATSPDHSHWHYLDFDRYLLQSAELRRVGSDEGIVADRKSGFCLGDRYRVRPAPPNAPAEPVFRGRCGLSNPALLTMREGISVGYGDDYAAFLEGQDLPLDGLSDGRYVLVHRVNADGRLKELSPANNAASVLIDLHWLDGEPQMQVLASCPNTDRCDERFP